jgi:hypothetical protein
MTTITMRQMAAAVALAVIALSTQSCGEGLLDVETPDVIDPSALANAQGISALHAGAVAEIALSVDGSPGLAIQSALFADESMHASTPPATRDWDLRNVPASNATAPAVFLNVQRARARTEDAASRIAALITAPDVRVGELWALSAFTYILLGELYCSGVPISKADPLTYGRPLTTAELMDTALVRLTTATGAAASDARILNLIAMLRGRALLNQGQFAQAATAVAAVPTNYVYQLFHSTTTPRQTNQIPVVFNNDIYSVPNSEGTNGLNFVTAADPRVPTRATGPSRNDGVTPMVVYTKYATQADPVTHASGVEARLIEAEAAFRAANYPLYIQKLNQARAEGGVAGLPATLTDPGTDPARIDLLFRERAFWMYLTAHRLGDLRRLVRQYQRPAESVYPTGAYHKQGLTRGTQVSFIIPQPEENNPEYDASACNPNAA